MKVKGLFLVCASLFIAVLTPAQADFKIGTYNIRNFNYDSTSRTQTNENELLNIIRQASPELLGLQEVVNKERFEIFVAQNLPEYGLALTNCGGRGNQHPGFLYRKSILQLVSFTEDARLNDNLGCRQGVRPAAIAKFRHSELGTTFHAINLHLKAGGAEENSEQRFRQLAVVTQIIKEIKSKGERNLVVTGDLNTTDYIQRGQNYRRFLSFTDVNELVDFSKELKCTSYWWGGQDDGIEEASVLDHVMVSDSFAGNFKGHETKLYAHCLKVSCQNSPTDVLGLSYQQVSDHCPVVAVLKK